MLMFHVSNRIVSDHRLPQIAESVMFMFACPELLALFTTRGTDLVSEGLFPTM